MAALLPMALLLVAASPQCQRLEIEVCIGQGYEVEFADAADEECPVLRGALLYVEARDGQREAQARTGRRGRASVRLDRPASELLFSVESARNGGLIGVPLSDLVGPWLLKRSGSMDESIMRLRVTLKPAITSCQRPPDPALEAPVQ